MANTKPGTKTSLYIANRWRNTWLEFKRVVPMMEHSDWIMDAIARKLRQEGGQEINQETLRQTLREELRSLALVQPTQPRSDDEYDDLADKYLGRIQF